MGATAQAVVSGGTAAEGIMAGMQSYMAAMLLNPTTWIITGAMFAVQELLSGSCTQEDMETAMLNASGMCHDLGSYCSDKWPLVGCVQKSEAFCCFNSKLARIIQEQGRPHSSHLCRTPGAFPPGTGLKRGLPGVHGGGVPDARFLQDGPVRVLRGYQDASSVHYSAERVR